MNNIIVSKNQTFFWGIFIFILTQSFLLANNDLTHELKLSKLVYTKHASLILGGNVVQQLSNDGLFPYSAIGFNANVIFPTVDDYHSSYYWSSSVVYQEGILWGGKVNDGLAPVLRVNGATYKTGMVPGCILGIRTGNTENPDDTNVKIWRVRRDWETANLVEESYFLSQSEEELREAYQSDWLHWPVEKGAPFEDVDGDGQYNPDIDIPGVPGADQTIWYVANDINGEQIYGSPAIGIEMQMTLWTYHKTTGNPFSDMIFKRVRFIYKGTSSTPYNATIDSMFVTQWVDPDIGDYAYDLVGCDTTLQLAFSYNGKSEDVKFQGYQMKPPAVGYMLLAGPCVPSLGDTAVFNFGKRVNWRNLPLSAFYWFAAGYDEASDPIFGIYQGTTEWYNLMRGFMPQPGYPSAKPWIDPINGLETKFPLYGDPLHKTGWYDGVYVAPSDRRMGISTGPFQMALGDTQEVVFAFLGEQWKGRQGYLQAIMGLKSKAKTIKNFLQNGFSVGIVVNKNQFHKDSLANLKSNIVFLEAPQEIQKIKWNILSSPVGSNPQLNISEDSIATLSVDAEGYYTIQVTVVTSEGQTNTGEITLYAYGGQPPIADFFVDKYQVLWGDSIIADASASSDSDGDSLSYQWVITHHGAYKTQEKDNLCIVYPYTAGRYSLMLTVSDGFFEDTVSCQFYVEPVLKNISIKQTLTDTSWFRAMPYFWQNYILIPMHQKDFMRIYKIATNDFQKFLDIGLPNSIRIRGIKNDYIFVGLYSTTAGYYGPGPISIYQFDSNWNLTPVLENYAPNGEDVWDIQFGADSILVLTNYRRNFYWIDFFTNPLNPIILRQEQFPSDYWFKAMNDRYIFLGQYGNSDSLYVFDKFDFSFIKAVDWQKRYNYYNGNDDLGKYSIDRDFLFAGNKDSLNIYKIIPDLNLEFQSSVKITPPFYDFATQWFDNAWAVYAGSIVADNMLRVSRFGCNVLYDFSDPTQLKEIGYYDDGYYFGEIKKSGDHYLSARNDLMGYDEIVEFILPQSTGLFEKNIKLPLQFHLYNNYPNPLNPETIIGYDLPQVSKVELVIYNILGQKVRTLVKKLQSAGRYQVQWNGRDAQGNPVATGVYMYKLKARTDSGENFVQVKKMILMR